MRLTPTAAAFAGLLLAVAAPTGAVAAEAAATADQAPATQPAPPPPPAIEAENLWHLDLSTGGRVSIQLRPDLAPGHVERIRALTRRGVYDGTVFHRVIEGFMAQGGDPLGTGRGGSDLPDLTAEFNALPHVRGAVSMARAQDPNSANSQFFIMLAPRLSLDGNYTVFGRVVAGMAHVDAIARGEPPLRPSLIVKASIGTDNVAALSPEQLQAAGERAAAARAASAPAPAGLNIVQPQPLAAPAQAEPEAQPDGE